MENKIIYEPSDSLKIEYLKQEKLIREIIIKKEISKSNMLQAQLKLFEAEFELNNIRNKILKEVTELHPGIKFKFNDNDELERIEET